MYCVQIASFFIFLYFAIRERRSGRVKGALLDSPDHWLDFQLRWPGNESIRNLAFLFQTGHYPAKLGVRLHTLTLSSYP